MGLDLPRLQPQYGLPFLNGLVKGTGLEIRLRQTTMGFQGIWGQLDGLSEGALRQVEIPAAQIGQSQVRMRLSQLRLLCKDFLQGRNGFGRLIPREFQTPSEVETWDFSAAAFEDLVNNGCRLVPLVLLQEEFCQLLFGF